MPIFPDKSPRGNSRIAREGYAFVILPHDALAHTFGNTIRDRRQPGQRNGQHALPQ
jgi:hypothetical protein